MDKTLFLEKLEWEWKMFCIEMTSQSRENLFVLADMISAKKKIHEILKKPEVFSEEELAHLLSKDNMMDAIYMNVMEMEDSGLEDAVRKAIVQIAAMPMPRVLGILP